MHDPMLRIIAILQKYMRDPAARVAGSTTLGELEIDHLDLPMICLDVEDAFDVQISHDDEIEVFATVDALAAHIAARVAAQALQPRRLTTVPRSKGNWISTGGARSR